MFKDSGSNRRTNATVSFQKQTIAMGSHSYFTFTMSYQLFKVSSFLIGENFEDISSNDKS